MKYLLLMSFSIFASLPSYAKPTLDGVWVQKCVKFRDLLTENRRAKIYEETFGPAKYIFDEKNGTFKASFEFVDFYGFPTYEGCDLTLHKEEVTGTYTVEKVEGDHETFEGAHVIKFTPDPKSFKITPKDERGVDSLNKDKKCGFTNWKINESKICGKNTRIEWQVSDKYFKFGKVEEFDLMHLGFLWKENEETDTMHYMDRGFIKVPASDDNQ